MPGPGPDLLGMLGALGKLGKIKNPLEETLRREGLNTDEYLRYHRLRSEDRNRLAAEGVEWVLRCKEFDERLTQKLRDRAEQQRAEMQETFGQLGAELQALFEGAIKTGRSNLSYWVDGSNFTFDDANAPKTTSTDTGTETSDVTSDSENTGNTPVEEQKVGKGEKLVEALERLAALKAAGHIDDDEYKKAKKKLLK